jgi:hypothetical protein
LEEASIVRQEEMMGRWWEVAEGCKRIATVTSSLSHDYASYLPKKMGVIMTVER